MLQHKVMCGSTSTSVDIQHVYESERSTSAKSIWALETHCGVSKFNMLSIGSWIRTFAVLIGFFHDAPVTIHDVIY